jgi:thiamine-phosphate pyrophosphorylase
MKFPPQGLERIGIWKKRIGSIPLVTVGGLNPERALQVLNAGADCACVVTDIVTHADPESRTREWINATAPWRH